MKKIANSQAINTARREAEHFVYPSDNKINVYQILPLTIDTFGRIYVRNIIKKKCLSYT